LKLALSVFVELLEVPFVTVLSCSWRQWCELSQTKGARASGTWGSNGLLL